MKLLTKNTDYLINNTDYCETIEIALQLQGEYNKSCTFHCFWKGILNEKHLYSILSCYYFNVYKNKHKIILWLEDNTPNQYNIEIAKYAEIKYFSLDDERNYSIFLKGYTYPDFSIIVFYSDFIRSLLLYNYGGIWFDLDCFFLRSFDILFSHFENQICLYQWADLNWPNNAIYISLEPKSEKMKKNMEFIVNRNNGWGFKSAELTYDLPLDILVLPCSWFDPDFINNPYNIGFSNFFINTDIQYDFDTFFKGSFCYHWHNQWNKQIEDNSIIIQLVNIIRNNLQ
jgi:hypothetical protein